MDRAGLRFSENQLKVKQCILSAISEAMEDCDPFSRVVTAKEMRIASKKVVEKLGALYDEIKDYHYMAECEFFDALKEVYNDKTVLIEWVDNKGTIKKARYKEMIANYYLSPECGDKFVEFMKTRYGAYYDSFENLLKAEERIIVEDHAFAKDFVRWTDRFLTSFVPKKLKEQCGNTWLYSFDGGNYVNVGQIEDKFEEKSFTLEKYTQTSPEYCD